MIRVINGKRYDTAKSEELMYFKTYIRGEGYVRLYRTEGGTFFLSLSGSALKDERFTFREKNEDMDIRIILPGEAFMLLQQHSYAKGAIDSIEKYFKEKIQDA